MCMSYVGLTWGRNWNAGENVELVLKSLTGDWLPFTWVLLSRPYLDSQNPKSNQVRCKSIVPCILALLMVQRDAPRTISHPVCNSSNSLMAEP